MRELGHVLVDGGGGNLVRTLVDSGHMENTNIQWATHTFNPWMGCSHVHAGCKNCYAERDMDKRLGKAHWGPNGTRVRTSEQYWRSPRKWNAQVKSLSDRPRIFPSLCDPFEDWRGPILDHRGDLVYAESRVPMTMDLMRTMFFELIDNTPRLDWLLLTKRPENIRRMWPNGFGQFNPAFNTRDNVWLLYSASDQGTLMQGVKHLKACRDIVPVLGLSLEPLLGEIDLAKVLAHIDWVIVGGESGDDARSCNVDWIRDILTQCKAAGVPCFVKQLGAKVYQGGSADRWGVWPDCVGWKVQGMKTEFFLPNAKGGNCEEWPEFLRVQEFPSR